MSPDVVTFSVSFRLSSPLPEDTVERIADCARDMLDTDIGYWETAGTATISVDATSSTTDLVAEALRLAEALSQFGANIIDVDEDLVDTTELAERTGVTHEAARKWTATMGFPLPAAVLTGGSRLWDWASVNTWLRLHKPERAEPCRHLTRLERARVTVVLRSHRYVLVEHREADPVDAALEGYVLAIKAGQFSGRDAFPFRRALSGDYIVGMAALPGSVFDGWLSRNPDDEESVDKPRRRSR